ncbi:MAG: nitroreductase family protein [Pseudomonadota bacterium]
MEAIDHRRSVRAYRDKAVGRRAIETLLHAAVQAPSAMNAQPWAFAVIQDMALLRSLSDRAKAHLLRAYVGDPRLERYRDELSNSGFDIFYGAGTLVVVCATPGGLVPAEDCCLAGQNLMLAACGLGLGTCCIGWARPLLSLAEVKGELDIPEELMPVLPIIVGYPSGETPAVPRRPARVVCWK